MSQANDIFIDQASDFTHTFSPTHPYTNNVMDVSEYLFTSSFKKHYNSTNSNSFVVTSNNTANTISLTMNAATSANIAYGRYLYDVIAANNLTVSEIGITDITVTGGGTSYVNGYPITITGGGGTGASAFVVTNGFGNVVSITVISKGTDYTSTPTADLSAVGGGDATATIDGIGQYDTVTNTQIRVMEGQVTLRPRVT